MPGLFYLAQDEMAGEPSDIPGCPIALLRFNLMLLFRHAATAGLIGLRAAVHGAGFLAAWNADIPGTALYGAASRGLDEGITGAGEWRQNVLKYRCEGARQSRQRLIKK